MPNPLTGGMLDYAEAAFLGVMKATTLTAFVPKVGLFTTMPDEDGTNGVEVNVTTNAPYARQTVVWGAVDPGAGVVNSAKITFPTALVGGWGTIVGFGIFDAGSSGHLFFAGPLTAEKLISEGDALVFEIGELQVILD